MIGLSRTAYYWRRLQARALRSFAAEERELAYTIANIRGDLAALGFPVDHLSDEELIEGIARAGRVLSAALPTMDEAARGLAVFGRMLRSEAGAALASEPPRP